MTNESCVCANARSKNGVGEKSANKRAFIKLELYLPKSADSFRGLRIFEGFQRARWWKKIATR